MKWKCTKCYRPCFMKTEGASFKPKKCPWETNETNAEWEEVKSIFKWWKT